VIEVAKRKTKQFRGSMTHGRGKKGGRGAGLRGGKGNAGLLKHKYMYAMKNMPDHFGRHGFKRHSSLTRKPTTINVGQLEEKYPGKKEINLSKEGFDKLLGGGKVNTSLKITVKAASEKAKEKIAGKQGEVKIE
jgi:large subunit ribosomal protein L15